VGRFFARLPIMFIADLRREYSLTGLRRSDLNPDAIIQFQTWFEQVTGDRASGRVRRLFINLYKSLLLIKRTEQVDITAMTLATVDSAGQPSARVVLLKAVDPRGFSFYTNYNSRKGRELAANPRAALVFFWPEQERQVCVAGIMEKLPSEESDAYFHSRPRGSQIAACASDQSQPVKDRADLEAKWRECEAQFAGRPVQRPSHWGGFLLKPRRLEFWQGRPNRLHDRFCYTRRDDGTWNIERLAP
jgi:pyridoxamine 5'-phosphate oxidase